MQPRPGPGCPRMAASGRAGGGEAAPVPSAAPTPGCRWQRGAVPSRQAFGRLGMGERAVTSEGSDSKGSGASRIAVLGQMRPVDVTARSSCRRHEGFGAGPSAAHTACTAASRPLAPQPLVTPHITSHQSHHITSHCCYVDVSVHHVKISCVAQ